MFCRAFKVFVIMAAAIEFPLTAAGTGPVLPEPTGNYSVGRITYYLLDSSRNDERGTQKDHKREFMVQVWYPAQSGSKGKPAAWLLPEWVRLGNNYSDLLAKSRDPLARKDVGTLQHAGACGLLAELHQFTCGDEVILLDGLYPKFHIIAEIVQQHVYHGLLEIRP